jgi:hypothetical protein
MTADGLITGSQAATLKRLAQDAYELDAFKPNLTRTEADIRIAMLTAKLKLLDEPPHTLWDRNKTARLRNVSCYPNSDIHPETRAPGLSCL